MKKNKTDHLRRGIFLLLIGSLCGFASAQTDSYLIEAEEFQFKGKWAVEGSAECSNSSMLRVLGGGSNSEQTDAITVVSIEEAGEYNVWVRSNDHTTKPGTRLFQLSVDEQPMDVSGNHGKLGFYWENVGALNLEKRHTMLRLHDVNRNFARCDAVLLLKDNTIDPNQTATTEIDKWCKKPIEVQTSEYSFENISEPLLLNYSEEVVARVENKNIRISFVKAGVNAQSIACQTEIYSNGIWRRFLSTQEDHTVFLLTSQSGQIDNAKYYPSWRSTASQRKFTLNGREYAIQTDDDFLNPFLAGEMSEAIPTRAINISQNTIEVHYLTKNGSMMIGRWTLPQDANHIEVNMLCQAAEAGFYSIGLAAFQPVPESYMSNISLPPMFQHKRVSPQPLMMLSSMMPQPICVVESKTHQALMTSFVSGDNTTFNEWGSVDHSPMGFAIKNQQNQLQPVAFSPVIGMADSNLKEGEVIERKFILGVLPAGWNEAVEYISENVYKVRDYRRQEDVSLTETMFNIVDLMRNKDFGGWDATLKGFYDIEGNPETAPTVVNSAPLATIGASLISMDEEFYLSHSLPTIEYTLSRSGYRWATDIVPSSFNKTLETLRLNPFDSQFSTSHYEGMSHLLGDLNPWLTAIALPEGDTRKTRGYSVVHQTWVQSLSAYKMTGDPKWLRSATSIADRFVTIHIYSQASNIFNTMPFYNTAFYTPWWDLIDLYEVTKDEKYLKAAQYGATHTIVGVKSFPAVENTPITIHQGDKYDGNTNLWWKGRDKYRLGFPRTPGDVQQKEVPDWLVSPVGLGFEQASTYFLTAKGKQVRPVFMSSWSPHLLRLYQYTQKPIYETYARNAIIGRFANYPGYYATGYTDLTLSMEFPYRGPDVSSIYYHHIAPHFAFTWDFLVSEAIQRSRGNISFPYAKQEGFVWFANRIYSSERGKIFKDSNAKLWMKRGLITIDNPTVNYITAVSDKNFWILLSSESDKEESMTIDLSAELNLDSRSGITSFSADGKTKNEQKTGASINTMIDRKGFKALSLPLASVGKIEQLPKLQNGMQIVDMGEPFGKVFLFRIRSQFGWDSVYGFAETHPVEGRDISIEIECNGESKSVHSYPFEWSFYRLNFDKQAKFKITTSVDGKLGQPKEITLKGR